MATEEKTELSLRQKQQMEALKLLSDWSKWLVTIETGAVFAALLKFSETPTGLRGVGSFVIAIGAILCFLFSIVSAGRLLYSIPGVVEALPHATEKHIDEMKDWSLKTPLITHERHQWFSFLWGLCLFAVAMLMRP
jgi:hypothetical protein